MSSKMIAQFLNSNSAWDFLFLHLYTSIIKLYIYSKRTLHNCRENIKAVPGSWP